MPIATDGAGFKIIPGPPLCFFSSSFPKPRMNSLSAQILPQVPLKSRRLSIQKAIVALAIGVLSASALLPGAQAAAQVAVSPSSISWSKVTVGNTGGAKTIKITVN